MGEGDADSIPDESAGGDDASSDNGGRDIALYRISDSDGSISIDLVSQRPLQQSLLDSNDCFVLDTVDANIYVWVGKHCNAEEKQAAMRKAQGFIEKHNYPAWTHILRIVEGAEPTAFAQYFQAWRTTSELHARLLRSVESDEEDQGFEPRLFHVTLTKKRHRIRFEEVMDFEQEDLNEDDVMILDTGKEIFVWIGNGASDEEKEKIDSIQAKFIKKYNREDVPITTLNQGEESSVFQDKFPIWVDDHWSNQSSYHDIKARIHELNNAIED